MDRTDTPAMRKRLMNEPSVRPPERRGEIDIANRATLAYSSEDPAHPVEHLIDGHYGRGSTHWASARTNATERIVLEFDHPQQISCLSLIIVPRCAFSPDKICFDRSADSSRNASQTPPVAAHAAMPASSILIEMSVDTFRRRDTPQYWLSERNRFLV